MRTLLIAIVLVSATSIANADVTGVYDVKFEEVSTNCSSPLRYPNGSKLVVKLIGNTVTVDLDRTPLMHGIPSRTAKLNAKSKVGPTMVDGMSGTFSVAGKVTPEGLIHLVLVGEYSVKGKPLCSQSWNVSGPRVDNVKAGTPKKQSRASVGTIEDRSKDSPVMAHLVDLARIGR
jgi:hypothetical protein